VKRIELYVFRYFVVTEDVLWLITILGTFFFKWSSWSSRSPHVTDRSSRIGLVRGKERLGSLLTCYFIHQRKTCVTQR